MGQALLKKVDLNTVGGGAAPELFMRELEKIAENITDLNTDASATRKITMTFVFKPVDVPYILRLHQRAEEVPKFSLHECDGGMWRVETTKAVRKWLQDQVMDLGLKAVTVL